MARGRAWAVLLCVVALTSISTVGQVLDSQVVGATSAAAPPPPTGLTAKPGSATQINLVWTAVKGAASYRVFRAATAGGSFNRVGTPTVPKFADKPLAPATTYYYAVQSVGPTGQLSSPTGQVSATTLPATPTGVKATAASASQINLTWIAVTGAATYRVLRATSSGGTFTKVGSPTVNSLADTALSPATTYFYVVQALTSAGVSSARSAQASTTTMTSAPDGLVATAASASEIDLTWNAVTGATGYTVLRATTSGGPYATAGSPSTTSFGDTGLNPATTYFYVVQAVNSSGASASSAEASAVTAPGMPTAVVATPVSSSEIDLTWSAVGGVTGYTVERSAVSGGPYATVGSPSTASFADTGLNPATTYFYVIQAVSSTGVSTLSAPASALTFPSAPSGLSASAASASEIDLSWAAVTGATGYTVLRAATSGGPYTPVGAPNTTSFADTGLAPATTYHYVVEAINSSGTSVFSPDIAALTVPGAPSGLNATAPSTSVLNLTWNPVSGATSYVVQRSAVSGGPYSPLGSPSTPSFADNGLTAGTTYYYVVAALNSSGASVLSAQFAGTTLPAAPSGVSAITVSSSSINVTWNAVTGATGYTVLRATTSGGPYTNAGSPSLTHFSDTGLSAATTYYYAVRAVDASGPSAPSTEVSATTVLATPTGVTATPVSTTEIDLSWNSVSAATSYAVQRSTTSGGPYTTVGSPSTSSLADAGLSAGTTYFYVVRAAGPAGTSAASAQVSAITVPAVPTGVTATPASASEIDLSWNPGTGASSYTVKRATSSGGPYTAVGSPTVASFADTGLNAGTTYFYEVAAIDASGTSALSAPVSAATTLSTPTGVTATAVSASAINLSWNSVTGATGYTVQRAATSGGPYATIGSPSVASFADTGLSAGTTYFYVVRSVGSPGTSAASSPVSAITVPAAPTGVTATAGSASEIDLSWSAVTGASSYTVQRATSSAGPYTAVGSPTTSSLADTGLSAGTTYYYLVATVDGSGTSAASGPVSATTLLATPTGVVAAAVSASEVDLSWNAVTGAASYVVQRAATSGGPYTTVGSPIVTSFADTALSAGATYFYVVRAVGSPGTSGPSTPVSAVTVPPAPAGLSATAASGSEIDLSWGAVTGATSYTVQRADTSGGPYTTVGSPSAASFADTGLSAETTYFYVVTATNPSGTSPQSAEVQATTALAAPTGITATGVSPSEIDLSWNSVTSATGYTVRRASTAAGPYTTIGSTSTSALADTGLSVGTTYFYEVQATGPPGPSAFSAPVSAVTAPPTPTGVVATAAPPSDIDLTWSAVTGASSYTVQRAATSGGPYTTVGSPSAPSFADTGLSPNTTYFYVVQAVNASGVSGFSTEVSAITVPAAPTGLTAIVTSGSQVNLTWNAVTGATSYAIGRATASGGPYTTIGSPSLTSFSDTGLSTGTTYFYVVRALNSTGGTSAPSAAVSATTPPPAPSGISATTLSATQIKVQWAAVSGAISYAVSRATVSGGPYAAAGSVSTTKFTDSGLSGGTTYYYVVQALNSSGASAFSAEVFATTALAPPTGLTATAVTASEIDLAWNAVTGATGYTVQRAVSVGGPYAAIGSPTTTTFADTGLHSATTYYYVVQALNASGPSAFSAQLSVLTVPGAPSSVTATPVSPTEIDLAWGAVAGATSYRVQRSIFSGGPYTTVASPAVASLADTGLSSATTYYYVVLALDAGGASAASTQITASTPMFPPTGVLATAVSSSAITVTWTAVTGATSYAVSRATVSGGPYTSVGLPTNPTFADSGLSAGTTYYYVVQAVNSSGTSPQSAPASTITIPAAPTGVAATPVSASEIDLSWNAVAGATSYVVLRSISSGGPFNRVGSPTAAGFADTGLRAATAYFYLIEAVNSSGTSVFSSQVSGVTLP
jgi:fibronectin type 3 domain-containing protein